MNITYVEEMKYYTYRFVRHSTKLIVRKNNRNLRETKYFSEVCSRRLELL